MTETGVILVEFHSAGQVAQRAREMADLGNLTMVADNTGSYSGPGPALATPGNIGFGAACNLAESALPAEVDVIVLMNPDVQVDPQNLVSMVGLIRAEGWDCLAPATLTERGERIGFAMPRPRRDSSWKHRGERLRIGTALFGSFADHAHCSADTTAASVTVSTPGRFGSQRCS